MLCVRKHYDLRSFLPADTISFYQLFVKVTHPIILEWGFTLVSYFAPLLVVACISHLILTKAPLPTDTFAWLRKIFSVIPLASSADEGYHIAKKNQFLKGEVNFHVMAIWLVAMPVLSQLTYLPASLRWTDEEAAEHAWDAWRVQRERTLSVSYLCGWIGCVALSWFLIPVARHSVLLVVMGWSPVHALRMHIVAGHISFLMEFMHALTMFIVWFRDPFPVHKQFIPPATCWAWDANFNDAIATTDNSTFVNETSTRSLEDDQGELKIDCAWQFYNLTGLLAMTIFTVLWVSSLHWFRRKNYRLFYLLHVTFGSLMLLFAVLHFGFLIVYFLPSIAYYLASTAPTLIQALAARFRGGVKITKVLALEDAGGCVEVHVAATREAALVLDRNPSQFVKLCVPQLSVVWHPFTVFSHTQDRKTLRFLFRPVGPFTQGLADCLTAETRPVTILDGFYGGPNRCGQVLSHDCVTIVAGGVAITPFLSMIPATLSAIEEAKGTAMTKSIILHWACRETGLISHVVNTYLKSFQKKAASIPSVKLEIVIYCTQKVEALKHASISETILSSTTHLDDDTQQMSAFDLSASNGDFSHDGRDSPKLLVPASSSSIINADIYGEVPSSNKSESSTFKSFPMEVARMMPSRFKNISFNLPLFISFSGTLWAGFAIIFETYHIHRNEEESNFKRMSSPAFFALLLPVFYLVAGFCIEGSVLLLRKFWPSEHLDDFELVQNHASSDETEMRESLCESTTIEMIRGRPTAEQMLTTAREHEAPGIFMCGPVQMIDMVRRETSKENSWLGRTRFCLYEESFEF
jgi:predicted ferric reductase